MSRELALPTKQFLRAVAVIWDDALCERESWSVDLNDLENLSTAPAHSVTLGFVLKETDDIIIVAQSINSEDAADNAFRIPKVCVLSVTDLLQDPQNGKESAGEARQPGTGMNRHGRETAPAQAVRTPRGKGK